MENLIQRRIALNIEYDGTNFHGWQVQPNFVTVQSSLQDSLNKLVKYDTSIIGSGRTDTGVHATMQIAHADIVSKYSNQELTQRLNIMLPNSIYIKEILTVTTDFHSRFSAVKRGYNYKISLRKNPFLNQHRYFLFNEFDFELLNLCAEKIVGKFDFTFFSKNNPDTKNSFCTVCESKWEQQNDELIYSVVANRFLYGMVRLLVSFQLDCATKKRDIKELDKLLSKKQRSQQSKLISPSGLYLNYVEYQDYKFII